MNIKDKFTELENRNEGALIAYICAGDPTPEATTEIVHALVSGGADIIELGRVFDAGMNHDPFFDLARSLDVDPVARRDGIA